MNNGDAPVTRQRRLVELMPVFLDTVILWWAPGGGPEALSGLWAPRRLPTRAGLLHVLTAADPGGETCSRAANRQLHSQLLHRLKDLEASTDQAMRCWPAVGSSPDGKHAELGVVFDGLATEQAVALGREFDQLAVFALTDDQQQVVPCIPGVESSARSRTGMDRSQIDVSWDDLERWWSDHAKAFDHAGISGPWRSACGRCGSERVARIIYGLPVAMPPPWLHTGGCIVDPANPSRWCEVCGGPPPA